VTREGEGDATRARDTSPWRKEDAVRLRKGFLSTAVVAAMIAAAVGAAPAGADGKPGDKPGGTAGIGNAVPADVAAGVAAPAVSRAVSQASATIQSRIADFVAVHGTKSSFGVYVDRGVGKVIVQTDAPGAVVSSLVSTFGAMVEVRTESGGDDVSRKSDTSPFWGGSGVAGPKGICTSGYVVQNSAGTRFLAEAGHCFDNGQTATTENGGLTVGSASGNGLSAGQDMVLLGGQSYGSFIYTGGVDDAVASHVLSASDPVVGFANYCTSGRTTGNNCGHTDIDNNAMVCTVTGCKSPVIAYTGGVIPQGGDSGAPFYVDSVSAPDKHIRGHHIAHIGSTAYAELYSRVANRFGVSIVT
jgi:hypothetical protein